MQIKINMQSDYTPIRMTKFKMTGNTNYWRRCRAIKMPIDVSSLIDTITLENCLAVSMKAEYIHTMYNFSPSIDPTETCIYGH